ncbi:MAG: hypothetical protein KGZ67_10590 [Hydrogenophaga sp.]|jgi:hypothetical protein|nr:hypothetical protein [Hydrogenophaga sp.]
MCHFDKVSVKLAAAHVDDPARDPRRVTTASGYQAEARNDRNRHPGRTGFFIQDLVVALS